MGHETRFPTDRGQTIDLLDERFLSRFTGAEGHLSGLQADGDEKVAKAFKRLAIQEFRGEINREVGGIFAELAQECSLVEVADQRHQFFNLL